MKEDYDGAEPAASSVSIFNLLTLAHLTNDQEFSGRLERALTTFAGRAAALGRAVPMLLAAISTYHTGLPQIVVVGEWVGEGDAAPLIDVLRAHYLPTAIVVPVTSEHRDQLGTVLPWTAAMMTGPSPAAYVCRNFTCERPVRTAGELEQSLASRES